ncbi:MAG: hypothetical protein OXC62_17130 [Aestuariivita sp.]|nr:hypothetical protein [Aestuariivita sp.]
MRSICFRAFSIAAGNLGWSLPLEALRNAGHDPREGGDHRLRMMQPQSLHFFTHDPKGILEITADRGLVIRDPAIDISHG